jgi:hypothetical protein
MFGIHFGFNVMAYAAFVRYSELRWLRLEKIPAALPLPVAVLLLLAAAGFGAVNVMMSPVDPWLMRSVSPVATFVGAAAGATYLTHTALTFRPGRRSRPIPPGPLPGS